MSNVNERLNALKNKIEQGKAEKARAEANLETYTKQREEIVAELESMGVKPENLDAELSRLEQETLKYLDEAEGLLRG